MPRASDQPQGDSVEPPMRGTSGRPPRGPESPAPPASFGRPLRRSEDLRLLRGDIPAAFSRPLLAREKVRFVGEPLALVLAETAAAGVDAAELVRVDTEPLEPVVDPEASAAEGAPLLFEEQMAYDANGTPLTGSLTGYCIPGPRELPAFERSFTETPTPKNPLGVKGVGEAGAIGSTPAVQNAVIDALAHLGVTHLDMPLTAERVWRAIRP